MSSRMFSLTETEATAHYTQPLVADPGFPIRGWGWRQPPNSGQKPIIWHDFCRKVHENESGSGEGACPWHSPSSIRQWPSLNFQNKWQIWFTTYNYMRDQHLTLLGSRLTSRSKECDVNITPSHSTFSQNTKLVMVALMPTLCSHIFALFFIIWILWC